MANSPCQDSLMCHRDPNCPDQDCPGAIQARAYQLHRIDAATLAAGQRALHTEDGGTWVTDSHRVLRLHPPKPAPQPQPQPRENTFTSTEWAARFLLWIVGAAALAAVLHGITLI